MKLPRKAKLLMTSRNSYIKIFFPNFYFVSFRSGQPLPPSVQVVGATLQFPSQSNDLSGLYQCEAKNPYGSKHTYLLVHFSTGELCCEFVFSFMYFYKIQQYSINGNLNKRQETPQVLKNPGSSPEDFL